MSSRDRETIFACIVNKETGEVDANCARCCVLSMDNQIGVLEYPAPSDHIVIEITQSEYQQMQEVITDKEDQVYAHKVDLLKSKRQIKNRDKEEYTINEYGISYKDMRPVKAIKKL